MDWRELIDEIKLGPDQTRPAAERRPRVAAPPVKPTPKPVAKAAPRRAWKHLSPSQFGRLRNLLFSARVIVEGAYSGRHRSPYKGASPEFVDYREYYPGDELRTIDWKAVARTDRLLIRLFEKQTDMNCHLMVDTSASMAYGGSAASGGAKSGKSAGAEYLDHRALSKLDYALCLAAALAFLMIKQGDKAGLTLFDRKIRYNIPPGGTFGHLYTMLNLMERQKPREQTHLARALRTAFPMCRSRGLLLVFSDLIGDDAELFSALNLYRHKGFEIILFHILHEHELTLPPEAHVHFIDAETAEGVYTHPADIQASYRAQVQAWIEGLRGGARGRRIDYHTISTATPYEKVLEKYLLRRSRL